MMCQECNPFPLRNDDHDVAVPDLKPRTERLGHFRETKQVVDGVTVLSLSLFGEPRLLLILKHFLPEGQIDMSTEGAVGTSTSSSSSDPSLSLPPKIQSSNTVSR